MSEPDQEMVIQTQSLLGKVITKPVLTEKLLRRPPFKFLHDIIVNVIKSTGFMKEVYVSEDMSADNIKDKESKIIFLQKCIDILEIESGKKLDLRPSKVVAGLEADKTNHFLQLLAKVAIAKKHASDSNTTASTTTSADKTQEHKSQPATGNKMPQDTKPSSSDKRDKLPAAAKQSAEKLKTTVKQKDEPSPGSKAKSRKETAAKTDVPGDTRPSEPSNMGSDREADAELTEAETTPLSTASKDPIKAESVRASARPPASSSSSTSSSRKETESTRPTTARAAPPRVSRKQADDAAAALVAAEEENQRLAIAKPIPNLISEGSSASDGDALFLVTESAAADEDERKSSAVRRGMGDEGETKGSLMKHLMETKKELEGRAGQSEEEKVTTAVELQDVEKLRASLQSLSRSANPLGRVLDALQEDIDAMMTEMGTWAEEFRSNTALLHSHKDSIDGEVEKLRARKDDLDQEIADHTEKISASKAAIHKHEQKLSRVIALVVEKS